MQKGSRLLRALHGIFKKGVAVSGSRGPQAHVDQAVTTPAGRFNALKTQTRQFRVNPEEYEHFQKKPGWKINPVVPLLGVGVAAAYITNRQEVPYTKRKHLMLLSMGQEKSMGEQVFQMEKAKAKTNGTLLPEDHRVTQRVRKIGLKIAAAASKDTGGGFSDHMKGLEWEFIVIQSPDANAFVVPGGKVVVFSGLLKLLNTDDQLAAVLSHEVAHVVARHSAERMTLAVVISIVRFVTIAVFDIGVPNFVTELALFYPHSRRTEEEADTIGVRLAAMACYDPAAAAEVFTKLGELEEKSGGGNGLALLRTHPVSKDRVACVKRELPAARLLYEQSGCGERAGFFFSAFGNPVGNSFESPESSSWE